MAAPPVLPNCPYCGVPMSNPSHCSACGGEPDTPPVYYKVDEPIRLEPRRSLLNPLYHREWLRGTSGVTLALGALVFLGPTIILPAAVNKPLEMDWMVVLSLIVTLVQCAVSLGAVAEWEFLTKKIYVGVMTGAFVASLLFGFGDLTNVVFYAAAGGMMLLVRILNTVALALALFAGNAVKQIPVD